MGICATKPKEKSKMSIHNLKTPKSSRSNNSPLAEKVNSPALAKRKSQFSLQPMKTLKSDSLTIESKKKVSVLERQTSCQCIIKNSQISSKNDIKNPTNENNNRGFLLNAIRRVNANFTKKYVIIPIQKFQQTIDVQLIENKKTGIRQRMQQIPLKDQLYVEWLTTQQINHINILRTIEIYQDNESYFLINEYFDGQKLSELMRMDKMISEELIANIADQMLSVLIYCQDKKIIHSNLTIDSWEYQIIDNEIIIKLVDIYPFYSQRCKIPQNYYYYPPESIDSNNKNISIDQWSIFIILLSLCKGQLPYDKKITKEVDIKQAVLKKNYNMNENIPLRSEQCKMFLQSVLEEKNQEKRNTLEVNILDTWITLYKYPKELFQVQILKNILNQKGTTILQQTILEIMILQFDQMFALEVQNFFLKFDINETGYITKEQFLTMIKQNIQDCTNPELKVVEVCKSHNIKSFKYHTFLSLTASRTDLLTMERLESAFNIITNHQPVMKLKHLNKHINGNDNDLEKFYKKVYQDVELDLYEFLEMMISIK